MKLKKIIRKLNWFYTLEKNQVDLYTGQSENVEDIYTKKTLKRVSLIEQKHVENIADQLKSYGAQPTVIGDVLGPLMGKIAGKITGKTNISTFLKFNIALEKKAMQDYKKFISKINNASLSELLWAHLIDEDLHAAWFTSKSSDLKNH